MRDRPANNFDALRLAFAALVALYHAAVLSGTPGWGIAFDRAGFAVAGFFVVSGWLVTASYERSAGLVDYGLKRVLRLYPAYAAVILTQALVLLWLDRSDAGLGPWLRYVGANLAFLNFQAPSYGNALKGIAPEAINGSLWTIKIEVLFYVAVPVLVGLRRRLGLWIVPAIYVASTLYVLQLNGAGAEVAARQLPGQLRYFAVGMALHWLRPQLRLPRGAGLAALALGALAMAQRDLGGVETGADIWWMPLGLGLFVYGAAYALPHLRLPVDASYGLYLAHFPICMVMLHLNQAAGPGFVAAAVGLSLAIAWISAKLIEEPALRLAHRPGRFAFAKA